MKVSRGISTFAEGRAPARCGLVIGNFDGVHRGHQSVLWHARVATARLGIALVVLTFNRHPKAVLTPACAPTEILPVREKLLALEKCDVDHVVLQPFTRAFASLTPEAFIEDVLVGTLNIAWLQVSKDFRFGAKRAGDFALLAKAGEQHSFTVSRSDTVLDRGVPISSSTIRQVLSRGDMREAERLLGRDLAFAGTVLAAAGARDGKRWLRVRVGYVRPSLVGLFNAQITFNDRTVVDGVVALSGVPGASHREKRIAEIFLDGDAPLPVGRAVRIRILAPCRAFPSDDTCLAHEEDAMEMAGRSV
ncbi:hypothetical protein [Pandoraea sp. ISTKB]|uniref:hypothetical protein n=1 Tax=Pandoraea sp. ISTKB TaxID=1586708 RepID=UPI0008473C7C|nr:hypothetical protein [Pandoraea sp. ISTKB]ODP34396.1 hypothetical protein A9762_15615 [Pandoraea sp. ISTKB]